MSYIHHYLISDSRNLVQLTCRGLRELPDEDCGIAWHALGLVLKWTNGTQNLSLRRYLVSRLHSLRSRPHSDSESPAPRIRMHYGSKPHIFTLLHISFVYGLSNLNSLSYFISASTSTPEHSWELYILLCRMLESTNTRLIYITIQFLDHESSYSSPAVAFANCHMGIVELQGMSSVSFLSEHTVLILCICAVI
jgi:hypothetical protein